MSPSQRGGAFDGVFQLRHISGPKVGAEDLHGLAGDLKRAVGAAVDPAFEEMGNKQGDIIGRFAQGGQGDGDHVEAVIKVFAEGAFLEALFERLVGGGDDADIDLDGSVFADAPDFALLQDAEEAALEHRGHGADFIEEDGSAVGFLKQALFVVNRAGERAAAMAEQLGFEQILRQGAAIDRDEGGEPAVALEMVRDSLRMALEKIPANDPVVITGSLYLVGEALELLGFSPAAGGERELNEWQADP